LRTDLLSDYLLTEKNIFAHHHRVFSSDNWEWLCKKAVGYC